METGEIIARANEAVKQIYEKMGKIESCEAALKTLDGAEIYIGKNKTEILDLHAALNDDQIADIMTYIHTTIRAQIDRAAGELNGICNRTKTESALESESITAVSEDDNNEKIKRLEKELFGDKENKTGNAAAAAGACRTSSPPDEVPKGPKASKSTLPPDEEEKLLRKLYMTESRTVKEIADIMGLTKANIYDRIKKYGLRNERYEREWDGFASESAKRN